MLAWVVTFLGAWAYCAMAYGFLLGFGFGWLPAVILAFIVAGAVWLLWLPLFLLFALMLAGILR
jgi:hypothetical protein